MIGFVQFKVDKMHVQMKIGEDIDFIRELTIVPENYDISGYALALEHNILYNRFLEIMRWEFL